MKILYVSSLIFKKSSSASIRNIGLIEGLVENNIDVEILTIKYPERLEDGYLKNKLKNLKIYYSDLKILNSYLSSKNELNGEKKVNIIKKMIYKGINIIKPVIKDLYFFPDVDKEWISEFDKLHIDFTQYDLIISSSDTKTSHYIGEKIKKSNPLIPWFQIWGDPWASDIGLKGLRKLRAKIKEGKLLEKADKVFYVSPFTVAEMKMKYKKFQPKINYIPRGFLEEVIAKNTSKKELIMTYTGVLNENRNITPFLEKIKEYNEINKKKIIFKLYGSINEDYLKKLKEYKFFEYMGSVSFEKIKEVYRKSDYLLFIDNGGNTTQIPGKIYDYLGTNRKIVCLFKKENKISDYFKNKLNLLVFTNENIDMEKIIKSDDGKVNLDFSNKKIAKTLLNYYMEMKK